MKFLLVLYFTNRFLLANFLRLSFLRNMLLWLLKRNLSTKLCESPSDPRTEKKLKLSSSSSSTLEKGRLLKFPPSFPNTSISRSNGSTFILGDVNDIIRKVFSVWSTLLLTASSITLPSAYGDDGLVVMKNIPFVVSRQSSPAIAWLSLDGLHMPNR